MNAITTATENTSDPLCGDCHVPADEHGLCPHCDVRIASVDEDAGR